MREEQEVQFKKGQKVIANGKEAVITGKFSDDREKYEVSFGHGFVGYFTSDELKIIEEKQEVNVEEIKFQDRTRDGYEYVIYTREGKNQDYPIVGSYKDKDGDWITHHWTNNEAFYKNDTCGYDLIPVKPLPLEDKKVGDKVWSVSREGLCGFRIIELVSGETIYFRGGTCCHIDGSHFDLGNGKQLFFPTEEEARKSVEEDKYYEL